MGRVTTSLMEEVTYKYLDKKIFLQSIS